MSFQPTLNETQQLFLEEVNSEYTKGFLALNYLPDHMVTFYGGAKIKPDSETYNHTKALAGEFAQRDWGVVSGGGPGIMAASLIGAKEAGGKTVAFRININEEVPVIQPDVDLLFKHFSVRKYLLRQSNVFIFCPGGFGTLDEFMEILTLIATKKHPEKPIYLLDSVFWKDYVEWFETMLFANRGTLKEGWEKLFKIVDTKEDVIEDLFGSF